MKHLMPFFNPYIGYEFKNKYPNIDPNQLQALIEKELQLRQNAYNALPKRSQLTPIDYQLLFLLSLGSSTIFTNFADALDISAEGMRIITGHYTNEYERPIEDRKTLHQHIVTPFKKRLKPTQFIRQAYYRRLLFNTKVLITMMHLYANNREVNKTTQLHHRGIEDAYGNLRPEYQIGDKSLDQRNPNAPYTTAGTSILKERELLSNCLAAFKTELDVKIALSDINYILMHRCLVKLERVLVSVLYTSEIKEEEREKEKVCRIVGVRSGPDKLYQIWGSEREEREKEKEEKNKSLKIKTYISFRIEPHRSTSKVPQNYTTANQMRTKFPAYLLLDTEDHLKITKQILEDAKRVKNQRSMINLTQRRDDNDRIIRGKRDPRTAPGQLIISGSKAMTQLREVLYVMLREYLERQAMLHAQVEMPENKLYRQALANLINLIDGAFHRNATELYFEEIEEEGEKGNELKYINPMSITRASLAGTLTPTAKEWVAERIKRE